MRESRHIFWIGLKLPVALLLVAAAFAFVLIGSGGRPASAAGATVTVQKTTNPPGDPQSFTINLTGPVNQSGTVTDAGDLVFTDLPPGTYTLSETVPSGWTQSDFECADLGSSETFSVGATDEITCTYSNTKLGSIIVQKTTSPSGSPQTFPVDLTGPVTGSGVITDASDYTFGNLPAGSYTITETTPSGWTTAGVTCGGAETNVGNGFVEVPVGVGEVITCEFTNQTLGIFNVSKDFQPDNPSVFVTVTLNCTSGTTDPPNDVDEASSPIMFAVVGFTGDPTCTATESSTPGYITTSCSAPLSIGECTLVNVAAPTVNPATFTPAPTPFPTGTATPVTQVGGLVELTSGDNGSSGTSVLPWLAVVLAAAFVTGGFWRARSRPQ